MLSNPQTVLQQRQRLHRRQNSTPVTYEAMKVPTIQTSGLQRAHSHRRGQSLDQRSPIRRPRSTQESVSITNRVNEQQILREAQQQRILRPGQRYQPLQSPQCGTQFSEANYHSMNGMPLDTSMYDDPRTMNPYLQPSASVHFANNMPLSPGMQMASSGGYEGIGLGLDENAGHQYFQQNQNLLYDMSNDDGTDVRRMSQPELQAYTQRPVTPTHQTNNGKAPRRLEKRSELTLPSPNALDASNDPFQAHQRSNPVCKKRSIFSDETLYRRDNQSFATSTDAKGSILAEHLRRSDYSP